MSNPYQFDPEAFEAKKRAVQQEKVVILQDDSAKPPPSVGASSFQGILFGPMANQPSKASEEIEPSWGRTLLRVFVWIWVAGIVIYALHLLID